MSKTSQATTPELQAILQNEQAMAAPRAAITQIEAALQQQQAAAPLAQAEFDSVQSQLRELMADLATAAGQGREVELGKRRTELERQSADSYARIRGHQQTIEGLKSRLESARAELGALQERSRPLIRGLLLQRAEAMGAEYVRAAQQLKALHERLRGTCTLLQDLGIVGNLGGRTPLQIPSFHLESVTPCIGTLHTYLILKEPGDDTHASLQRWVASVEDELRADGIHLDWR